MIRILTTRARRALSTALLAGFTGIAALGTPVAVSAGALDGITDGEASGALRDALTRGAGAAVSRLGKVGGFMNDPRSAFHCPPACVRARA